MLQSKILSLEHQKMKENTYWKAHTPPMEPTAPFSQAQISALELLNLYTLYLPPNAHIHNICQPELSPSLHH